MAKNGHFYLINAIFIIFVVNTYFFHFIDFIDRSDFYK